MIAANHCTECWVPDGGIVEGTEDAEGDFQPHGESKGVNRKDPPRDPRDWTSNQRVHIEEPMPQAAYVEEGGLVSISGMTGPWT